MFKDKQSPGVCGVEAEVLLYAQSPCEALNTYICISQAVVVQITHIVLICWFAVEAQGGKASVRRAKETQPSINIKSYPETFQFNLLWSKYILSGVFTDAKRHYYAQCFQKS